jgi:hypothetical protein
MTEFALFFPTLKRRNDYHTKRNGEYYEYGHYRQEIREDCLGRCVYCDVHEDEIGGQEGMHLDHFRPQKYPEYQHLANDPNNLVWACAGCNHLKSDHWPALGTISSVIGDEGFIEPFEKNRLEYFSIKPDGSLIPLKPPAEYMRIRLGLDRTSRKRIRELRLIKANWLHELDLRLEELASLLAKGDNLTHEQRATLSAVRQTMLSIKEDLFGS